MNPPSTEMKLIALGELFKLKSAITGYDGSWDWESILKLLKKRGWIVEEYI